jgi:hypothetical protein
MKDIEVKDKLDELNALSAGIVFGKEEAWDKLQARLDKKPAMKFTLGYKLAAAAVLLLTVSFIGYYFYAPEKQVVVNNRPTPAVITDTEQKIVSTPATLEPMVIATPEIPAVRIREKKANRKTQEVQHTLFVIKEETKVAPAPIVNPTPTVPAVVVTNIATPAIPAIKKMRVVHINEIGKTTESDDVTIAYSGPSLDISKMKVVSLYDIQREQSIYKQDEELMTIVRINRPHSNMFSITNPLSRNNSYNRSFAQSPFTIRLNKNN